MGGTTRYWKASYGLESSWDLIPWCKLSKSRSDELQNLLTKIMVRSIILVKDSVVPLILDKVNCD